MMILMMMMMLIGAQWNEISFAPKRSKGLLFVFGRVLWICELLTIVVLPTYTSEWLTPALRRKPLASSKCVMVAGVSNPKFKGFYCTQ